MNTCPQSGNQESVGQWSIQERVMQVKGGLRSLMLQEMVNGVLSSPYEKLGIHAIQIPGGKEREGGTETPACALQV